MTDKRQNLEDLEAVEVFPEGSITPVEEIDPDAIRKRLIVLQLEIIEFMTKRLQAQRYRSPEVDRLRIEYTKGISSLSNSLNRLLKSESDEELLKRLKEVEKLAAKTTSKKLKSRDKAR